MHYRKKGRATNDRPLEPPGGATAQRRGTAEDGLVYELGAM